MIEHLAEQERSALFRSEALQQKQKRQRERLANPSSMCPGAIRTPAFTLLNETELDNVVDDPGERTDVAARFPDEAKTAAHDI